MIKYLIVGLGNIGPEYHETRHNIGFMTVDSLAKTNSAPPFIDGRYGFNTNFTIKGRQLILLKPSTFMNLSGLAVRYWMQKENIPLENILIVVDDLALPFGTLRLKGKGSDAGHNGLKHIAATLGTQNYARLRFARALMSPPSPMALKPRIINQNPRKMGSVAAESPTLKIRMMPRMISMIPPAIIQPRPVMKCLLAEESTTSRMPEISISHPKTSDMPR